MLSVHTSIRTQLLPSSPGSLASPLDHVGLGHADPSITLRVYAHVIRRHAAGIADVFAAADHVDEDQDDEDDGRDPSAVVPC
ncbi:hypothetical protein EV652_11466 [Kribbella steppae]|uniref:Phage integrase family protein n=1 Tax=Kribbella steppae TaxID=2512223 RepID=A0A4R2H257_9ACTN|nr:hypothetical protein [Kribbella steppae]TCO19089.1 hypothetical protein EV652_11466 [Kribbella steppae]